MNIWQISPYLISILMAWAIAHIVKYIISKSKQEKASIRTYLFVSGGMPSAHSAAVMAMTTTIALNDGIGSGLFGLSLLFSMITMYDALKVRRSSGEQGAALRALIKESKSKVALPRVAKGHTPLEVSLGGILGIAIGVVVFIATH
ncbi:divergent PAP2 family protein [Candidatus Saccharibacteria bacterium]|nr:divergent PAP2 family protein [Candidatus Saccharibacteria bacterium]